MDHMRALGLLDSTGKPLGDRIEHVVIDVGDDREIQAATVQVAQRLDAIGLDLEAAEDRFAMLVEIPVDERRVGWLRRWRSD